MLKFEIEQTDGCARAGVLGLGHGEVPTPVFMPVGTMAAVRAMTPRNLIEVGTRILLANTYHCHLAPGELLIAKLGGIHAFMGVDLPVLTDSGGFQVFSLPKKSLSDEGVVFEFEGGQGPIKATPEWSMRVQEAIGADIIMAFDHCVPYPCGYRDANDAVRRSLLWLDRCVAHRRRDDQALFGIVQGSTYPDLRQISAQETAQRDLPGYAIGGVSVGEGFELMMKAVDDAEPFLPSDKPRYLMGVGLPEDIVASVARGIDMFDCVIPTRLGRSGVLFTRRGRIRVTNKRFRKDQYPPDTNCSCYTCSSFSRAYLHHLLGTKEVLGTILCTLHNLTYYHDLMSSIRAAIAKGQYQAFQREFEDTYLRADRKNRKKGKPR